MLAVAFLIVNLSAQTSLAKTLDLSTRSDPSGIYNVAFCARPSPDTTGKPGHAFVSYSHQGLDGDRDFLAIGHTVAAGTGAISATWSYFGDQVSGRLKEEVYTSIKQNCLDVQVNQEDFARARALANSPLTALGLSDPEGSVLQAYKLGADDCMTFLIDVANTLKSAGLKVPSRGSRELPEAYVARLVSAN